MACNQQLLDNTASVRAELYEESNPSSNQCKSLARINNVSILH